MPEHWHSWWRLTPQAWLPLSGLACTLALGLFVLSRERRTLVARSFIALNAAAVLWHLDVFFLFTVQDPAAAQFLDRLLQPPIVAMPFLALLFVFAFLGKKVSHPLLAAFGLWTLLLVAASGSDGFIASWDRHWYGYYGRAGGLYVLLPLTQAAYFLISCLFLRRELRSTREAVRRNQVAYVLAASVVFAVVSLDNFGPLYGRERIPLGNLAAIPYFFIIAATIVRHRLLDIRVLFRFGLLYSTLTFLLTVIYLSLVLALQGWVQFEVFRDSLLLPMIPALALAFAFVPLRNAIQKGIDRRFFPGRELMRSRLAELPAVLAGAASEREAWREAWRRGWSLVEPDRAVVLIEREGRAAPAVLHGDVPGEEGRSFPAPPVDADGGGSVWIGEAFDLAVTVRGAGGRLGCCLMGREGKGGVYGSDELAYLKGIAGQVALAVDRVRLMEEGRRRERLATFGESAAFVSHELRSPLGVIGGAVALLRSRVTGESAAPLVRLVEEEVRRADRVIRDFLTACREQRPLLRPVDMKALLGGIGGAGPPGAEPAVRVSLDLPGDEIVVPGDLFQIRRVFENLVRNSAEAGATRCAVSLRREGGEVRVDFRDDGPGIDGKVMPRLFEPFQTTKRRGTGLGLAIVKAVMETHGGRIEADNPLGGGSLFVLRFPGAAPQGAGREREGEEMTTVCEGGCDGGC